MFGGIGGRIIELTASLVMAYLVLSNADGFSKVMGSLSSGYVDSVKTLQARG